MIKKLEIICGIVSIICGIGLIVFSCLNIPGKELALFIFGIIIVIVSLIFMYLSIKKKKIKN